MSDLTCQELVELVTDFLEGTFEPDDEHEFFGHLAECLGCTNYLDQFRRVIDSLAAAPPRPVPDEVRDACLRAFRNHSSQGGPLEALAV